MNCTTCGESIRVGARAIFGIRIAGKWLFGWTCCHRPIGDVELVLASQGCAQKWLEQNPEYSDALDQMVLEHRHTRRQAS